LESIEASCLRNLNLTTESFDEVLVHDTIGGSKECEDVRDEIAFVIVELMVPIVEIFGEIYFFGCPKRGLGLLVSLPYLMVPECMLAYVA